MTALLYVLLAIVVGVGIWQIASIFNIKGAIATQKDNNAQGILFAVFGVAFYGVMIFFFVKYAGVMLPKSAAVEGER